MVLAFRNGQRAWSGAYGKANIFTGEAVTRDTIFDLASLTKPLATTLAVMRLVERRQLALETTLGAVLPVFSPHRQSRDYRCGFAVPPLRPARLQAPTINPWGLCPAEIHGDAAGTAGPGAPDGTGGNTNLLQRHRFYDPAVDGGTPGRRIPGPLRGPGDLPPPGLDRPRSGLFFVDVTAGPPPGAYAATEQCPWRGVLLQGRVHDENAYAVGGVGGHAGLFGTAEGVYELLAALWDGFYRRTGEGILPPELIRRFLPPDPDVGRGLGFDAPTPPDSSCGRYFFDANRRTSRVYGDFPSGWICKPARV